MDSSSNVVLVVGGKETWVLFSCEEDWGQRGLISSPRRILDQSRRVVEARSVAEVGGGGFLEGHSTWKVGFRRRWCSKNGGGGGGFLKKILEILGWRFGLTMMMTRL
ncbi:hypothetical protein U1Q18_016775 [Sarracenia purpurea var. burkii]